MNKLCNTIKNTSCQSNKHDSALKKYSKKREQKFRFCPSRPSLSGELPLLFSFFCFFASFLPHFFPPHSLMFPDCPQSACDAALPGISTLDLWLRGTGRSWGPLRGVCIRRMTFARRGFSGTGWRRIYPRNSLISLGLNSPLCTGPAKNSSELISKYRTAYKVSSPRTARLFSADNSSLLLLHSQLHHLTKASKRTLSKGTVNVSLKEISRSPSRSRSSNSSCSKTSLVCRSIYSRQLCLSAWQYNKASVIASLLAGRKLQPPSVGIWSLQRVYSMGGADEQTPGCCDDEWSLWMVIRGECVESQ